MTLRENHLVLSDAFSRSYCAFRTPQCSHSFGMYGGGRNFLLRGMASLAVISYIKEQLIFVPPCESPNGTLVCDCCSCPGFCPRIRFSLGEQAAAQLLAATAVLGREPAPAGADGSPALPPMGSGAVLPGRDTLSAGIGQKVPYF